MTMSVLQGQKTGKQLLQQSRENMKTLLGDEAVKLQRPTRGSTKIEQVTS